MFPPGTDVIVIAINRRGRVIDVRSGVYRVVVGAVTVTCREREIRLAEPAKPFKGDKRKRQQPAHRSGAADGRPAPREPAVVRSIDLHGKTVEQARTAVADFLSRAVMEGADTLEIVHGVGTGRVREPSGASSSRSAPCGACGRTRRTPA
jgi:DNA mismatch repair protein MutS2